LLAQSGADSATGQKVASTIPRYLVTLALDDQPADVVAYAQRGYATVIVLPLQTLEAVRLATEQARTLANLDVPLLLFLDRISEVRIDIATPNEKPYRRILRRRQARLGAVIGSAGCALYQVDVGDRHRFLVVRREVEKARVLDAVRRSLSRAPQLKRWLDWKGEPVVSIAVGLNKEGVTNGRLYNFLPMGEGASTPLMGYLDAPFFSHIDRRSVDLELPLNETLMEAAAEACTASALAIIEQELSVPSHAVFDLIAWTGEEAEKLDEALKDMGISLREAPVIPAIPVDGQDAWSSLSEISLWPAGQYSVLKARHVARHIGARLVSSDLDEPRIQRLKQLAARTFQPLSPGAQRLARWAEAFAQTLVERKVSPRTWSRYYEDINRLFDAAGANLDALAGKTILLDRSKKLRPAGVLGSGSRSGVYVRGEASKGKRSSGGIPLPPRTLTRRYRFLDEKIALSPESMDAFVRASLLRRYDPVEALAGLKTVLGRNANSNRRQEALIWAFQVWRAAGARVDDVLRNADLHVPTLSGWQLVTTASFSSSWTSVGRTLENYLVEAAEVSADCRRARDRLLVGYADWLGSSQDTKRHWLRFLDVIGVADGLRPTACRITRKGWPAHVWNGLLLNGKPSEGIDDDWCTEVEGVEFNYPQTDYKIQDQDEVWRLPGQIEHKQLTETAKEALCSLIFEHLKTHGDFFFQFEVGRFDRAYRKWDEQTLPTPLAVFLRTKPWIAASTREDVGFRRPSECWLARVRRGGPPRFLDRLPEVAVDLVDNSALADLVFSNAIGLRDWQSNTTAVDRLSDLATVAGDLASKERPTFRREYQRAWSDVVEGNAALPEDLIVAVTRRGQIETLRGDPNDPPTVILTQGVQRFEARVLSAAGRPVLDVGETSMEHVAALLEAVGGFVPLRLDGIGVQLLVDGEPFVPSATDPFLISFGLEWLPDIVVIGNELRAERLERGIFGSTLERRTRAIRVRICEEISLVVGGQEISPHENTPYYAYEHEELPTLILTDALPMNWTTLDLPSFKPQPNRPLPYGLEAIAGLLAHGIGKLEDAPFIWREYVRHIENAVSATAIF